jgi:hypothetical protein
LQEGDTDIIQVLDEGFKFGVTELVSPGVILRNLAVVAVAKLMNDARVILGQVP